MSQPVTDRLWPMLTGLVALVGGGVALQLYADRRGNDEIVVAIHAAAPSEAAEDGAQDDDDAARANGPVDDLHQKAQVAARRGELTTALELYEKSVAAHPDSVPLRDEYGYWLFQAKRTAEARDVLEEARRRGPDDAYVALHLGLVAASGGDAAAAEAELRRALSLRQSFGSAQRALGNLLRKRKAFDEAIAVLRAAASSGSNEERARSLLALGTAQWAAGKRADAERSFDKAIEFAPARVEMRIAIARAYLSSSDQADHRRAQDMLARAAELAPDLPPVHSALGRAHERLGQRSEAEAAYERALRLDPSYRYARRRALRIALERKDFARARAHAALLLQEAPDEPEHHFLAALVADKEDRDDDARKGYRSAIEKAAGNYPEAYMNLGLLEKRAGRLPEAIAAYERAIALRPDYLAALNNLALTKMAAGDNAGAEASLRRAIEKDPNYAAGLLNLGELLMKLDRHDEAIAMFERALAARPGYAQARLNLGVALTRKGRVDEALATYRALVQEQPRYVSGWFNLAVAAQQARRTDEARAAVKKALEVDPEHDASLRKLAELDREAGAFDAALGEWQELLDRDPGDREARLAVAELLLRKGDADGCARIAQPLRARADAETKRILERCARTGGAPTP